MSEKVSATRPERGGEQRGSGKARLVLSQPGAQGQFSDNMKPEKVLDHLSAREREVFPELDETIRRHEIDLTNMTEKEQCCFQRSLTLLHNGTSSCSTEVECLDVGWISYFRRRLAKSHLKANTSIPSLTNSTSYSPR